MGPNNIKEKLIKIFASHSVPDIEANNGARLKEALGEADYSLLLENDDYKEYFITLKELRDTLDDIVQDTEKQNLEQVK